MCLMLGAMGLVGASGQAQAADRPDTDANCFRSGSVGDAVWNISHPNGYVTFRSKGEILRVQDYRSNGWRIVAKVSWCDANGNWRPYIYRDSGPNDGPVDQEYYDFDFAEGRILIIEVCEWKPATGQVRGCRDTKGFPA